MKKKIGVASALSAVLLLGACGGQNDSSSSEQPNKKNASVTTKDNEESQASFNLQKNNGRDVSNVFNPFIKEAVEGDVETVYKNADPKIKINFDGFNFSVSQYQVVHIKNAKNAPYSFKGGKEGYVITLQATIKNQTDGKAYFNNPALQGRDEYHTTQPDINLVKDSDKIKPSKSGTPGSPAYYEKGEAKTGFIQYELSASEYKEFKNEKTKLVISPPSKDSMFRKHIGEKQTRDLPLSGNSLEIQKSDKKFYEDQIIRKGIAEKTMIELKDGLADKKSENKVELTLEGFQFTKLAPSVSFKKSFTGFGNEDIVAATFKLHIKNNQGDTLPLGQFSSFLDTDKRHYLNQGSLEYDSGDLRPGQSGTKYLVFLMKKSELNENPKFKLRIRHIEGNSGDALNDREVDFNLVR
ncbi:DUF5068 domain-containing protein [Bacillus velezensis]|uniref:DUF5068 domain-containing protein n=1 Tax=Bacillus velezensis TaxID=492670 RepID=UPI0037F0468C|nr:DUF5068 domain-containing protein [Bacillus velezensis]MDH3104056.1 DUF5068 domain-containing protein [Bacillus velezensis]MDH3139040.1 DUF5068 domain-containing protein [Bacillus velezensis]